MASRMRSMWLFGAGVAQALASEQIVLNGQLGQTIQPINVAIIGAGAAGSSAAYHLAKFAADLPLNITIFEQNSYVGGRSTTVYAYDDPSSKSVELGASIFVQVNHILANAVTEFNLSTSSFRTRTEKEIPGAALAVWDGDKFVVTQYGSHSWWDTAKLLWKYGLAPVKTISLMKATVAKFLEMYEEPIFPFISLTQAAQDVGLLNATAATGETFMTTNGITGDFGHDIVQASTRVNYAQNLGFIHGLEAMVCMATDGAMSIEGGNWQIFDAMINASHATKVLGTKVTGVREKADGTYVLTSKRVGKLDSQTSHGLASHQQSFDSVVVAAPFQYASIDFDPPLAYSPEEIPYVQLHVTLFTSSHLLSPQFFGLKPSEPAPKVILTTLPKTESALPGREGCGKPDFWSISLLSRVTNPTSQKDEYLYKIFSPQPTDDSFIAKILAIETQNAKLSRNDVTWLYRKTWNSYPYERPRVTFESLQLGQQDDGTKADGRLWYTGGIESFISTMETSALMGKNVARLMIDRWLETLQKADNALVDRHSHVIEL